MTISPPGDDTKALKSRAGGWRVLLGFLICSGLLTVAIYGSATGTIAGSTNRFVGSLSAAASGLVLAAASLVVGGF